MAHACGGRCVLEILDISRTCPELLHTPPPPPPLRALRKQPRHHQTIYAHCTHVVYAGFNVEHVAYKNIDMTMWDVGGQTKLRHLWHHYYEGSNALIYVVDSNDVERLEEAREELHGILSSDAFPSDAVVLVFANKQDLPSARPPSDVASDLGLPELRRKWYVQGSCASNGDGLFEGMDWLATTLNEAGKA